MQKKSSLFATIVLGATTVLFMSLFLTSYFGSIGRQRTIEVEVEVPVEVTVKSPVYMPLVNSTLDPSLGEHFNLVIAPHSIPVNITSMYLWDDENTLAGRSYLWFGRLGTFGNIPALAQRFNLVGNAGQVYSQGIPQAQMNAMAQVARDHFEDNSNNTFTLFVNDYNVIRPIRTIIFNNLIPMCNFNIVVVGSMTGDDALSALEFGNALSQETNLCIFRLRLGDRFNSWHDGSTNDYVTLPGMHWLVNDFSFVLSLATLPNVEYWGWHRNAIQSALDESVVSRINFNDGDQRNLMWYANRLNSQGSEVVESFRYAMFYGGILDAITGAERPVMMITGTSFTGEQDQWGIARDSETHAFELAIEKILYLFGDEYDFVFKGHPNWNIVDGWENSLSWRTAVNGYANFNRRVAFLNEVMERPGINFSIIPCQLPADMIMLFFGDYPFSLGGWYSSLFNTAVNPSPHTVAFLILPEPSVVESWFTPGAGVIFNLREGNFGDPQVIDPEFMGL